MTSRELWKSIENEDVFLYINFKTGSLRVAPAEEIQGAEDEISYAVHPSKYKKSEIEQLCRDLGLKNIIIKRTSIEQLPPKLNYTDSITAFDNPKAKEAVFMLRKTSRTSAFESLKIEPVLAPVKVSGLNLELYYLKTEKMVFTPVFTTKNEYTQFQDFQKENMSEYSPLRTDLKYLQKLKHKSAAFVVNPATIPVCNKSLGVTLNNKLW